MTPHSFRVHINNHRTGDSCGKEDTPPPHKDEPFSLGTKKLYTDAITFDVPPFYVEILLNLALR